MNQKQSATPTHIAIIMDGNRRWAKEHNLPVLEGHRRVADKILEPLIEYAADCGITYMTFWAWSTENWTRDKQEVEGIMRIFRHIIKDRWDRLHKKGVRIRVIGDISKFSPDIRQALEKVIDQTKNNTRITAVFALNYGGRDELRRAVLKAPKLENFEEHLDTKGIPDPDMIVRTGGELRLSGFLPWQSVHSELYFPTWYMPEFTPERLDEVIAEFNVRERRFGK